MCVRVADLVRVRTDSLKSLDFSYSDIIHGIYPPAEAPMPAITADEAIAIARTKIHADAAAPARAWHVRRLDRVGESYYLVVVGDEHASTGVVAVGAAQGDVQTWANLPGQGPHVRLDHGAAMQRSGLADATTAEMVWKPCRATRSPLYPLWEIQGKTKTVYVDQQGTLWPDLPSGGPGG